MRKHTFFIVISFLGSLWMSPPATAASPVRAMKEGIRAYDAEKYKEALSRFEEAEVEAPEDPKARYNAASARYKTGDFEAAAKEFKQVLSETDDPKLRGKASYNLGNTAFRKGDLKASSDFYRKALLIDPEDRQAKENLEFVLKSLKKQKQEKKQQPQKGENPKNQKGASQSGQQQDQKQRGTPQDQPTEKPQQQAKEKTQNPDPKGGGEKEPSKPTTGKEDKKKQPEGQIREAGGAGKEKKTGSTTDARQGRPAEGQPLSPDEAERLLNSLSDDQRAYFRKQAARKAPNNKRVVEDW